MSECQHGEPRGPQACPFCRRMGLAAKEIGQCQAASVVDAAWWDRARARVQYLAHLGDPFTVEDVIAEVGLPNNVTSNANNAVGALISRMAKKGLIKRIGYTQAARPESHARAIAVWQGRSA